jgi:hypothetical protein
MACWHPTAPELWASLVFRKYLVSSAPRALLAPTFRAPMEGGVALHRLYPMVRAVFLCWMRHRSTLGDYHASVWKPMVCLLLLLISTARQS